MLSLDAIVVLVLRFEQHKPYLSAALHVLEDDEDILSLERLKLFHHYLDYLMHISTTYTLRLATDTITDVQLSTPPHIA